MTDKEKQIQEEINKTLGLLDTWEKPAVNPFFYGKLEHRMQNAEPQSQGILSLVLPKLTIATLMLLFVCNMFTLVSPSNTTDSVANTELVNFAEQYNISVTQ